MALFQAAARTSIPFAETRPDFSASIDKGARSAPLEIDVGCHKGRFLVEMAQKYPSSHFVGVERQWKRVDRARQKICRLGLGNAAVVHGDGLGTISQMPAGCADYVHVLFPDPWPKRRHKIRRMVGAEFLREVSRILKSHGILRVVTDDAEYVRAIESCALGSKAFRRTPDDGRDYPPTEFQVKFFADSRPVYTLFLEGVIEAIPYRSLPAS